MVAVGAIPVMVVVYSGGADNPLPDSVRGATMYEGDNCWVDGSDGVPCANPRAGIYGVELVLWLNDDGSPVKGVQDTPLCDEHRAQAQRDGVAAA